MKIRVPLVIEVDPQMWADANGQIVDGNGKFTAAALREDVRTYFLNLAQRSAMADESGAEASLA
jgi:hypothetical protein